jgi:hypothetical protein
VGDPAHVDGGLVVWDHLVDKRLVERFLPFFISVPEAISLEP